MKQLIFDPDGDVFLLLQKQMATDTDSESEDGSTKDAPAYDIRMQVSSKHLILASSVFKSMLQGHFVEGQTLRSTGSLDLPLPDDDPDAFTILLNVIHGRSSDVPQKVGLSLMIEIAILVDKYQLLEAVGLCSDRWIGPLESDFIPDDDEDMIAWLSIFWVFRNEYLFQFTTQMLLRGSRGIVNADNLPIPQALVGMV